MPKRIHPDVEREVRRLAAQVTSCGRSDACSDIRGTPGRASWSVARLAQVDRKTVRRCVGAAEAVGLSGDGGLEQLSDEVVGLVCEMVRPVRPGPMAGVGRGACSRRTTS